MHTYEKRQFIAGLVLLAIGAFLFAYNFTKGKALMVMLSVFIVIFGIGFLSKFLQAQLHKFFGN